MPGFMSSIWDFGGLARVHSILGLLFIGARKPQLHHHQLLGASSSSSSSSSFSRAQFGVESFASVKLEPSALSLVSFKPHEAHEVDEDAHLALAHETYEAESYK